MGNPAGAGVDVTRQEPARRPPLPDGLIAVVKRDCPTCQLIVPVLEQLAETGPLTVYTQDDPAFPESVSPTDDTRLAFSWHHDIETVPTLILAKGGNEEDRTVGWSRPHWEMLTGVDQLGAGLPEFRPGCGSLSVDPSLSTELAVRFGGSVLQSRRVELARLEDPFEAAFDRGWTDGLPVVPPTEARVMAMLEGSSRSAADLVAEIPPDLHPATVEQIAINAVMAGCKPEYFPVVLAAVEAACTTEFNMHGLLATTYFSGPVLVVNGPITKRLDMNSGSNAFGQGNRANLTIGRALQLVVRNLGGGRPGEVDMAMLGSPGKLSFCFAEREHDSPFSSLAVERGFAADADTVTVFAGSGPTAIVDQISRTPESLVRSFAVCLRSTGHPKLARAFDAMLVVSPEHARIFAQAGWDKDRLRSELDSLLTIPGVEMVRGVDGISEGLPEVPADGKVAKFRPGGLQIVHAGGEAGLFSAILDGWVGGDIGSEPVTVEIQP